jgi:hypothetical protein
VLIVDLPSFHDSSNYIYFQITCYQLAPAILHDPMKLNEGRLLSPAMNFSFFCFKLKKL